MTESKRRGRGGSGPSQAPIVGIGASAGGVRALQQLFDVLPADTGAVFVVILHLSPESRSELAQVLAARTAMPVRAVDGPLPLEANHVYVIPPDRALHLTDHSIDSADFVEPRGHRTPIDAFFRSLAAHGGDGYAVILSGAGADGVQGAKAINEAGGIVLVQDPQEAEHASMPNAAISAGVVDVVLPVTDLGRRLADMLRKHQPAPRAKLPESDEESLRRILAHVRVRTGNDFTKYKRSTVLRRIQRRAQVARREGLADYYTYLRDNADEAQALFADLLISVTAFFRDNSAFEALAQEVVPLLFDGKGAGDQIRIWTPGCATGEEAYSIGMLLLEEAARRDLRPELQVFGSDLDATALAVAREGRYPAAIEADVSEERLRRFFSRDGDHYRVKRELRDIVLFASHSLLRDPPFSRIDLISCRNLLIYLERELQQQVIGTFHYALNASGFLFLGSSESAEHPGQLFRLVDREAHIYQGVTGRPDKLPILPRLVGTTPSEPSPPARPISQPPAAEGVSHREALEQGAPPSILVDESHHAIHLSETAGRFLQPSGGPLSADIIELVRPELRLDLRAALYRAFERGEASLSMPIPVRFNGHAHRVYLQVRPVTQASDRAPRRALVIFIEGEVVEESVEAQVRGDDRTGDDTVRRLAEELRLTQARLRTMREESEAANEELRAANEELQSINEEYRSTSEELETSKEELQSVNEELQTVNNELKIKLEGVSRANSDLQNLMDATDVATLFLDPSLRIKRFTPRLTELFNVTANDEGRPITDFTHQLEFDDLPTEASGVLRNLAPVEREVKSRAGRSYLMRLRPYRTLDDRIDGVVATFFDITERSRIEEALRNSEDQLRQETRLVELSHAPIFVWDLDGGILQWNRGCEQLYGYPRDLAIGQRKNVLLRTEVPGSSFEALIASLSTQGRWGGELIQVARDGRRLTVLSELELVTIGERRLVLESAQDITDRKMWQERQDLMLKELTHRIKNTLTVVQSIAAQSIRGADGPEIFTERFEGRIAALAAAHRLLVDPWKGADLEEMAREQLTPHAGGAQGDERLRLSGERIVLSPDLAVPLGLVMHELATNAVKYGAWASPSGVVELTWRRGERQSRDTLSIVWRELDGPPVITPERTGFGSRLIESGIPRARVRRNFRAEGLECVIDIPLTADSLRED